MYFIRPYFESLSTDTGFEYCVFLAQTEWLSSFQCPECKVPNTLNHCTSPTFSTAWGLVSRSSYEISPKLEYVLRFPGRKSLWLTPAGILKQDFERWPSKVSSSLFLKWLEFNSQTSWLSGKLGERPSISLLWHLWICALVRTSRRTS